MAEWKSVSFEDGVDTKIATHTAVAAAHHVKYTDAEAVAALATADDYVKNTGDTMTGDFSINRVSAAIPAKTSYLFDTDMYGGLFMYEGVANVMTIVGIGSTYSVVADRGYVKFMARINNLGGIMFTTNAGGETTRVKIKNNGHVFFYAVASGATQGAAGAAASEIWKTSGHATLPNNVLMIGV